MQFTQQPVQSLSGNIFVATFIFISLSFLSFGVLLLFADITFINAEAIKWVFTSKETHHALWMSLWTSTLTTMIALFFAIPMGYALSRYRFPGHIFVDTAVDLPIVFPPLVAGMTLLVFFSHTSIGRWIEDMGLEFVLQPKGIVLCQFALSASFAIRSAKVAFDDVDTRYEHVALTLGCSPWRSFFKVSLPLAKGGITAGAILTWARAFGIFGPLMIFVGTFRGRTEVLSTTIYLEQSVGRLENAMAISMLLIIVAACVLIFMRRIGGRSSIGL
ncbi:MAG: ABC transporter permease [Planctomycetes bacterium]|nr:ABC transporter permease [Planctomycetota bacterium]